MQEKTEAVIISERSPFMVNSLYENMKNNRISVEKIPSSVEALKNVGMPCAFILYIDDFTDKYARTLTYLKDRLEEEPVPVYICIIGDNDPVDKAKAALKKLTINETFLRPVNVRTVTEHVYDVIPFIKTKREQPKILVVDAPAMLKKFRSILSSEYTVRIADSALSVLTSLAKNPSDMVLVDYNIQMTGGKQVLKMIRQEPAYDLIPVVIMLSKRTNLTAQEIYDLHADGYLFKDHPEKTISEQVRDFLEMFSRRMSVQKKGSRAERFRQQCLNYSSEDLNIHIAYAEEFLAVAKQVVAERNAGK